MHLDPVDDHPRLGGREGLVLKLSEVRAVKRIRAACAEAVDVERDRPHPDLLIWREPDPERGARQLRIRHEVRDRRHDLGHPRLVVRAEQGVA
jgi:hypothetical protein